MKPLIQAIHQITAHLHHRGVTLVLIAALAILCTGCPKSVCKQGSVDMEPPTFPLGKNFNATGPFYNDGSGLAASIVAITLPSGATFFNNATVVDGTNLSFGTHQVLRMNNVVLNFDLKQGTRTAQFDYYDQGGTINLGAGSGNVPYTGNMYVMPATQVMGAVIITKVNPRDIKNPQGIKIGEMGTILIKSATDLGGMKIGGQELYVDNFCFN